jgi:hypothetical protein
VGIGYVSRDTSVAGETKDECKKGDSRLKRRLKRA